MTSIATVGIMDQKTKLLLVLQQIDNITSLIQGSEYEFFMRSHLISVQIELERQLTNLSHSTKIKE